VLVVEVLLAPGGVDAGGLQMAVRVRADPHVLPGRGDSQSGDALDVLGLRELVALVVQVLEALAALAALDPGPGAVDSA
jgi:hypothetical protein